MKVSVIGTGYVGLVAGACFSDTGNHVICVDNDPAKIESLNRGRIPIYEPGLEAIVVRSKREGRLSFTIDTAEAVQNSEVIFIAVGTPPLPNGDSDLSYLKSAAHAIAQAMDGYRIVVIKSTVPIGTHHKLKEWIKEKTDYPFDVVNNPEFLKEGTAVDDFLRPDRVILGTDKAEVFERLKKLYSPFVINGNPILKMSAESAELAKYASNAFLATKISFMNELSHLCEKVGGDINDVRTGMSLDVRIGKHFLYAGAGYGGSCFPKDVRALVATAQKNDLKLEIAQAVEDVNNRQKKVLFSKINDYFKSDLKGKIFAIWGLAFKPNTDDIREAPALILIRQLLEKGAQIKAFDPVAMENVQKIFENKITLTDSASQALKGADALVVVTEWREFRNPDFQEIKKELKSPVIFDGRNLYQPSELKQQGFRYFSIGRQSV